MALSLNDSCPVSRLRAEKRAAPASRRASLSCLGHQKCVRDLQLPQLRPFLFLMGLHAPQDLEVLKVIAEHADLVGYSFVRSAEDVRELQARLSEQGGEHAGNNFLHELAFQFYSVNKNSRNGFG